MSRIHVPAGRLLSVAMLGRVCGIAGVCGRPGSAADARFCSTMAGELRHRGPDGTGLYLDGRFGMVNTRLAIVDLEGGDQPLS